MEIKNIKANVLIYTLILVSLTLVMSVVVFNTASVLFTNSDNYQAGSTWNTYYPNNFQDDDNLARKLIYSYITPNSWFVNIFWSNSNIAEFINDNSNNNDSLNAKLWQTGSWYLYLDVDGSFSLKLVKFNKSSYDDTGELIPFEVLETSNIWASIGYIRNNSWVLSLADTKKW